MRRYIAIIALAMGSVTTAHAALHKWVDAEGKVHYSDTAPPDTNAQSVRNMSGKGQTEAPASYSPKSVAEREAEMKKAKQEKEEASQKKAQDQANAEARKRNCEAARENVRTLEESGRIVTSDASGERSYMDDETRAKRLEEARKTISTSCD